MLILFFFLYISFQLEHLKFLTLAAKLLKASSDLEEDFFSPFVERTHLRENVKYEKD